MKKTSIQALTEYVARIPMLKVAVAVVVGILFAERLSLPVWSLVVALFISLAAAWRMGKRGLSDIYLLAAICFMGMLSVELHRHAMPSENQRLYKIEVMALNTQTADRVYGEGRIVGEYHNNNIIARNIPIRITLDSIKHITEGDLLTAFCRVRRFNSESDNHYEHNMLQQGFVGQVWLSSKSIMQVEKQPLGVGQKLQHRAVERLARLNLPSDVESISAAVTVGRRLLLSPDLREEYRRSGASHLLAVSGLHVGFIVVILNILLIFLSLLPHGQLLRGAFAIALIWLYVAVVGYSPSVVRAAVMFSMLQLSISLASYNMALNTLCLAAAIMLLCNPFMMHDMGFLLSFLAVAGILEWGVPLLSRLRRLLPATSSDLRSSFMRQAGRALLYWLTTSVVVSIVASMATMPLVAWQFGLTSLWGIVASPIMVLLCSVTVGASLVWMIFPIAPLANLFHWIIRLSASAMNGIAEWCASKNSLIFEEYIGGEICCMIYLFYIAFTLFVWSHRKSLS